jgi:drug/metabolite transporter (DMT)-like permease
VTRRGLILFGVMSLIWRIPYLFIRVAVAEISPATLVFARTAIAAVILLPIALLRTDFRAVLAHWRWVAAFGVVEIAIPWVMLGSAEQIVSSPLRIALYPCIGGDSDESRSGRRLAIEGPTHRGDVNLAH